MKKALCIISGGMDSATCAYIAKAQNYEIIGLHFDYNQRTMEKERECFERICDDLGAKKIIIDGKFIAQIGGNSLTDLSMKIREDGVKKDVPNSYVPFRNGIFLSIAAAVAEINACEAIFIGVVEEDSSGYPDCTNTFIKAMERALNLGRTQKSKAQICTPLVNLNKSQIVQKALELGVKLEHTWSCYQNSEFACGVCDSCRLRLAGFAAAGISDPIKYKI